MATTASDIERLREAYREARSTILGFADPLERDVGLAALRLEATHAYRELLTTARGLDDATLAPLKEYVGSLTGGERVVGGVDALDRGAQALGKQVLKEALGALGLAKAGGFAALASVLGFLALALQGAGELLVGVALAGGSGLFLLLRAGQTVAPAAGQLWERSWARAAALGVPSDRALAEARTLQAHVLAGHGAAGLPTQRFTDRVRGWAQLGLVVVSLLLAGAAILVVIGAYGAVSDWWEASPANPLNRTTTFSY